MASTYTPLGVELMATGENAGTWGTKTNTNLQLFEQLTGGYSAKSIAGGTQTTALTITDGNTTGTGQFRMIEFTGTITGTGLLGTVNLEDGDYTFAVQSENDKLTVKIKNDSHLPSNFINASWQGYYVTASSRV